MSETDSYHAPEFNYELRAKMFKLASSVGMREEKPGFHDTFQVTHHTSDLTVLHEILDAMGMTNTTFIDNMPDEVPSVKLAGCHFEDHTLRITAGGKKVVLLDSVEVVNMWISKMEETSYRLDFQVKCKPPLDEHFNLERCILDCHDKKLFQFEFGSPPQKSLLGDNGEPDE